MLDRDGGLVRGTLDVLILKALSWGPRHGYAVAEWVKTVMGKKPRQEATGHARFPPGILDVPWLVAPRHGAGRRSGGDEHGCRCALFRRLPDERERAQSLQGCRIHVTRQVGHDRPRHQCVRGDTLAGLATRDLDREQDICGLRLPVGAQRIVGAIAEVNVVEDDRRSYLLTKRSK